MIKLEEVTKVYKSGIFGVQALRGINLEIKSGEFVAIIGPSGSGKSTLLHIIGCLDRPTSGNYFLNEINVQNLSDQELAKIRNQKIGYVFQFFGLMSQFTIYKNLEIPLMLAEVWPPEKRREIIMKSLKEMGIPQKAYYAASETSAGEQQRVAIARALVNNADLILADEPTGNLDSVNAAKILTLFQELNNLGKTIVLITHDEKMAQYAKRIITLEDGLITKDKTIK